MEKKLLEITKIYKAVFKKIELRKTALLDYDKVYNDHESLLLKQRAKRAHFKTKQPTLFLRKNLTIPKLGIQG